MPRIIHTAIDWTNSCALWLVMKSHALSAFVCNDVIHIRIYRFMHSSRVNDSRDRMFSTTLEPCAISV